jgi:hypothetical protein
MEAEKSRLGGGGGLDDGMSVSIFRNIETFIGRLDVETVVTFVLGPALILIDKLGAG